MLFIGICGASGSGKSTLAHALEEKLGTDRCLVLQQDAYYRDHSHLTFEQRVKLNYDEPDIFDHDLLLKDISHSDRSEKAREEFYNTFDTTFLAMYPDFVEQFNSLLQEDARINPPKGRLTTELRIFALIRLGVDDSKRIATMLDYSLSTIYNYKVSVKNHAAVDRDSFEERVKMIGK